MIEQSTYRIVWRKGGKDLVGYAESERLGQIKKKISLICATGEFSDDVRVVVEKAPSENEKEFLLAFTKSRMVSASGSNRSALPS